MENASKDTEYPSMYYSQIAGTVDQITVKTPNPNGRLFVKIYLYRDLAAGVYLSEAPSPSFTHCINTSTYPCTYSHSGGGGGGQPVRRLEVR